MIKKMMLLAIAVAAVAAFAAPASALAGTHWIHEGSTVSSFEEDYTGFASFDVNAFPGTSFGCVVHVHLSATQDTTPTTATGTITSFEVTTNTCEGTGLLTGCELENDTSNTNWHVVATATDLDITKTGGEIEINNSYKAGCAVAASTVKFASITATPTPNIEEVECLDLSGSGSSALGAVAATGELCAYNGPTYGWEVV